MLVVGRGSATQKEQTHVEEAEGKPSEANWAVAGLRCQTVVGT
jgi:hypothetical protein